MASAVPPSLFSRRFVAIGLFVLGAAPVTAWETFPARLYEVTTETGMPHLEEALRYTVTHERRCMADRPMAEAFPVMGHPALQGCSLQNETRHEDTISYALVCSGGHGTTGEAIWQIEAHRIRGTLNVKLGGKNMTFYQRITAMQLGACER